MTKDDELVPMGQLVTELKEFAAEVGYDGDALAHLTYSKMLNMALTAQIPVERINNRWHWRRRNRARIAAAFGVTPRAAA